MSRVLVNDVYIPYLADERPIQIFYGGSSSGKSFFLAQRAVLHNIQGANYLICRNVAKTIRKSVFNEIKKAIYAMELGPIYKINSTDLTITCEQNGKQILFAGLDDVEKLKSITPAQGVLERIWIEEATEIKREAYLQLTKRLRGESRHAKYIVLSFNPILQNHWIYREFFNEWDDSKTKYESNEKLILKTIYRDNLFLTAEDCYRLENEKDPYFRQVYTFGNFGQLGHSIFKNWRVEDLSHIKDSFDNLYFGLDFGFSSDPTAFIACHYDKKRKRIYVFDEHYECGMHNDQRAKMLKEKVGKNYIICDSASPELISDLCRNGLRALPAKKGAGSINAGIDFLQRQEIIIDTSCQNFKNEILSYHWEEDKYGNALQRPVDRDNHGIDAIRMALENVTMASGAAVRL